MKKVFEVVTDNYKYGIQCNNDVEAMKWVFDNTNQTCVNSTTENEESKWDESFIYIKEDIEAEPFKISIREVFDNTATEPFCIYSTDPIFND